MLLNQVLEGVIFTKAMFLGTLFDFYLLTQSIFSIKKSLYKMVYISM